MERERWRALLHKVTLHTDSLLSFRTSFSDILVMSEVLGLRTEIFNRSYQDHLTYYYL